MAVKMILGPAGSGKTHRCLEEIRAALREHPEGSPLLFIAPKQATFQLEHQLLRDGRISGYSRLQIVSFERLAHWILRRCGEAPPRIVSESARTMVLRRLLATHEERLKVFRGSARAPGFAGQVSEFLRLLQQAGFPRQGHEADLAATLADKIGDAIVLLREYLGWLREHGLHDPEELLPEATRVLRRAGSRTLGGVWMDGFARLSPPQEALLAELARASAEMTLAFCLPESGAPPGRCWSPVQETVSRLNSRLSGATEVTFEHLPCTPVARRFVGHEGLGMLERTVASHGFRNGPESFTTPELEIHRCPHPEAEYEQAGRSILAHVRAGGRFRETAVLVRSLDGVAPTLQRVFRRMGIPVFVDQREAITHHPLVEMTRAALRVAVHGWRTADVLAVLKTGLCGLDEWFPDQLENEALAKGWGPDDWVERSGPSSLPEAARQAVAPLRRMGGVLKHPVTGPELAQAIKGLWEEYPVAKTLAAWDRPGSGEIHGSVLRQCHEWLDELAVAFPELRIGSSEWIPILESAFSTLTVGRVPPALDQVLLGNIERTRNPDLELVILPRWVEGSIPAPVPERPLLTPQESTALCGHLDALALDGIAHFASEEYLAYIAITRARRRVVISWSAHDTLGRETIPSRFLARLRRHADGETRWTPAGERRTAIISAARAERLSIPVALALSGRTLRTSCTRLEAHAACPFHGFITRSLSGKERDLGAFDARVRGTFEHELLGAFGTRLLDRGLQWDRLEDHEIERLLHDAATVLDSGAPPRSPRKCLQHETSRAIVARFIGESRNWMRAAQTSLKAVELSFGDRGCGANRLAPVLRGLQDGELELVGRLDRIDRLGPEGESPTKVLVLDYKHGGRRFQPMMARRGLEIQLPIYAMAVREGLCRSSDVPTEVAGFMYAAIRPERSAGRAPGRNPSNESTASKGLSGRVVHCGSSTSGPMGLGLPIQRSSVIGPEEFSALLEDSIKAAEQLATEILQGEFPVLPSQALQACPCDACAWIRTCRIPELR